MLMFSYWKNRFQTQLSYIISSVSIFGLNKHYYCLSLVQVYDPNLRKILHFVRFYTESKDIYLDFRKSRGSFLTILKYPLFLSIYLLSLCVNLVHLCRNIFSMSNYFTDYWSFAKRKDNLLIRNDVTSQLDRYTQG